MVAPDTAVERHSLLIGRLWLADKRGLGDAVAAVQPTVRPPDQAVGHGVRVFQAEAGEMHLRSRVGDVIAVPVGVEEEIRRVKHPDAAAARQHGGGDVQALGEGRKLPEILESLGGKVAEGVLTTRAALGLAREHGIEMPITDQMELILEKGKDPREAIRQLMLRPGKGEH